MSGHARSIRVALVIDTLSLPDQFGRQPLNIVRSENRNLCSVHEYLGTQAPVNVRGDHSHDQVFGSAIHESTFQAKKYSINRASIPIAIPIATPYKSCGVTPCASKNCIIVASSRTAQDCECQNTPTNLPWHS